MCSGNEEVCYYGKALECRRRFGGLEVLVTPLPLCSFLFFHFFRILLYFGNKLYSLFSFLHIQKISAYVKQLR